MPDYVYALHDFLPEHEDEVNFHAGERIEVVEKDDLYGDGWWQGRNLAGKVGLFPVSYTAPAPPAATTVETSSNAAPTTDSAPAGLQTLDEANESEPSSIASPVPKQPPATFLNGDGYESDFGRSQGDDASLHLSTMPDGEVMKATMTDVQKAIEQLGRGASGNDGDGARSFSFTSSRDGGDTDTDFDLSDLDGNNDVAEGNGNGEDWHKSARAKLAAKARRAIEEAEKLEAMMNGNDTPSVQRSVAPPIEVELSDESEDEGDYTRASKPPRHSYILEEDETEEVEFEATHTKEPSIATETEIGTHEGSSTTAAETQVEMPPQDESELPTATASKLFFPVFSPPQPAASTSEQPVADRTSSPLPAAEPTPSVPAAPTVVTVAEEPKRSSAIRETPLVNGLPSPTASTQFNSTFQSKHSSIVSTRSAPAHAPAQVPAPMAISTSPQQQLQKSVSSTSDLKKKHPTEWSVDEVIDWLRSKGFDQDVCDKFTEQEITGDVLLELDVNLLKTEIGIMAFGKRMRIANAITDLRRPPSVEYFDTNSASGQPSPMQLHHPTSPHSRTQSVSQSHHSFPGSGAGYAQHMYAGSSPSPQTYNSQGFAFVNQQFASVQEGPSEDHHSHNQTLGDASSAGAADGGVAGVAVAAGALAAAAGAGLGIAMAAPSTPEGQKTRPSQLLISPNSEGNLKGAAPKSKLVVPVNPVDEDRGHMSDGDIVPTKSMRRRLFGRSQDSTSLGRPSPIPSPTVRDTPDKDLKDKDSLKSSHKDKEGKEKEKDRDSSSLGSRHARAKKSIDGGKHTDRLSIFGGTFVGTLGKSRKPPPSAGDDSHAGERSSKFTLPRLHGPNIRKASSMSQRTTLTDSSSQKDILIGSVHDASPKDWDKDSKKDHSTLRKRTMSNPPTSSVNTSSSSNGAQDVNGVSGPIKQGQSILEQIGEPDHSGWMRKKGDRYNTWKLRYFVLKGPHMYILRSNSKAETRIKGYIHIPGYKVTVDENVDPGRYGFRIDHDQDKTHYFSSDEKTIIRDWMKAIMKATIGRDYTKPVVSSCNIPTIPLVVAQAMNPAPRPPSPSARDATQKALRREDPNQLSSRDARILMGLGTGADGGNTSARDAERSRLDSFFSDEAMAANGTNGNSSYMPQTPKAVAPPRPSREMRRSTTIRTTNTSADDALIEWANTHLPAELQITDPQGSLCGGLALLRLAESIKGRPSSPPVLDSAFPTDPNDDKLDGLFRLFDFLLDNDVKMGSVSINDVRQGKRDKILQLLRALKSWEEKRKQLATTLAKGSMQPGSAFMMPTAAL
ncbi:hypothetical protein BDN70DRAFT_879712 [Pholiota conissans]|uniref:Uncharacterized protein n=1 Tax=Pholiota conissans TaxID=109636 RepID=A0A9P6D0I9_9AGAR|nr:hypothetical protein BDN70DRAFT_879712 [Pholiota conissans]